MLTFCLRWRQCTRMLLVIPLLPNGLRFELEVEPVWRTLVKSRLGGRMGGRSQFGFFVDATW